MRENGVVDSCAATGTSRYFHGLVEWQQVAFVFGGCKDYAVAARGNSITACERMALPEAQTWISLPDMAQAKSYFNPCVFADTIYLFGKDSSILEAFHPRLSLFTVVDTKLPFSEGCCLYIYRSELIVRSPSWAAHYRLKTEQMSRVALSSAGEVECLKHQSSLPVVDELNGLVYLVRLGKCYALLAETGAKGDIWAVQ